MIGSLFSWNISTMKYDAGHGNIVKISFVSIFKTIGASLLFWTASICSGNLFYWTRFGALWHLFTFHLDNLNYSLFTMNEWKMICWSRVAKYIFETCILTVVVCLWIREKSVRKLQSYLLRCRKINDLIKYSMRN